MTIQTVDKYPWPWSEIARIHTASLSATISTAATLDGANDAVCWVGDPPATGNLTDVYIRSGAVAITSGPLNFDMRIEQLTNLRPNGTLWDTDTNIAVAVTDTGMDSAWITCTLTAAAAVTKGTPIGIRWQAPGAGAFSFQVAGWISGTQAAPWPAISNFPNGSIDTNGDGTFEAVTSVSYCMAVKIGGVVYGLDGCSVLETQPNTAFNSGSASDEYALRIYSPVPRRIIGMEAFVGNVAAGGDFTLSLWPNSAGNQTDSDALAQGSIDGDGMPVTTYDGWCRKYFATAVTLSANTAYWAGCRADTANNISLVLPTVSDAIYLPALYGAEIYGGSRAWDNGAPNTAPAFTTLGTTIPWIRLIVDGHDDGAGGGGGAVNPINGLIVAR